jgi:hypothetical protein
MSRGSNRSNAIEAAVLPLIVAGSAALCLATSVTGCGSAGAPSDDVHASSTPAPIPTPIPAPDDTWIAVPVTHCNAPQDKTIWSSPIDGQEIGALAPDRAAIYWQAHLPVGRIARRFTHHDRAKHGDRSRLSGRAGTHHGVTLQKGAMAPR